MFDQILGLPAHALVIHFAVVLVLLLAAVAVVHALVPRWRPYVAWAAVLLSLAGPAAVFAAKESGERLKESRFATAEGELGRAIAVHESHATPLLLTALGLAAVTLLLVYATRAARDSVGRDRFDRPVSLTLSGLTLALATAAGYACFVAGHSGARAVWGL
ncbi:DUF2231 domain-containing protein [Nonomuraea wenchangensis]|uniref:DUF2231 domain-containing protein n=1 Tax=Nonomuraea wenchangensis TaxID=568860 RepID=UPI0033C9143F